jgi:spermidine synthase
VVDSNPVSDKSVGASRHLPLLLLLFIGSGCSALIYEIVWFQLLQLVIGSSAVSLGVLLGTFMGGMCLGSLLLPRLISVSRHPLRVYALLEVGIGFIGLGLLLVIPWVGQFYLQSLAHGVTSLILRAVLCSICLLPPTILMGATLPAIARWMESNREGLSQLGFFYGANIAGAVCGCLLTGFYLLRVHDLVVATGVAFTINVAVALVSLCVAAAAKYEAASVEVQRGEWAKNKMSYVVIGLSGFTALGAEVIWTRQLSLMLGASVYTFSIILAVFLVGLCFGSSIGSMVTRLYTNARLALGICQLGLAIAIYWSCYALTESLPYWPIDPSLPTSPWLIFQLDLMRCFWVSFPATCLWGASFPLALAVAAGGNQDTGKLVGSVYAANTIGAILGSLVFSLFAIGWLGTQQAQWVTTAITLVSAWLMLGPVMLEAWTLGRTEGPSGTSGAEPRQHRMWIVPLVIVTFSACVLLGRMSPTPDGLIAYGRNLPSYSGVSGQYEDLPEFLYVGEGMNASIAVSEFNEHSRNFHVSGKVVASSEWQDMRLQRMLGHLPALLHSEPKSVLIVGCGAGVTAGSFVVHPSIERIVICEIEPLIPQTAGKFFGEENHHVVEDPRVEIIFDDARHFIATTDEKFDIITSDPIHPWVKGAAALYSKEYFEKCQARLNPGGIVTQWVPLYETSEAAVKSELATFFEVFPDGTVWSNEYDGQGYDIVLLGHPDPIVIDPDQCQERCEQTDHEKVLKSLDDVGFQGALGLLETFAGRGTELQPWLENAQLNIDRNLRLQFLAGLGLNTYQADEILNSMLVYYEYPEGLFQGEGPYSKLLENYLRGLEQE